MEVREEANAVEWYEKIECCGVDRCLREVGSHPNAHAEKTATLTEENGNAGPIV